MTRKNPQRVQHPNQPAQRGHESLQLHSTSGPSPSEIPKPKNAELIPFGLSFHQHRQNTTRPLPHQDCARPAGRGPPAAPHSSSFSEFHPELVTGTILGITYLSCCREPFHQSLPSISKIWLRVMLLIVHSVAPRKLGSPIRLNERIWLKFFRDP